MLDASVTASWAFGDEDDAQARLAFVRLASDDARVPWLWWFEVRNILVVNERRKRLTPHETAAFLGFLSRVGVQNDDAPVEAEVLRIARQHRLTVYDAAYLELAMREAIPLATLDQDLAKAARKEKVVVLGQAG